MSRVRDRVSDAQIYEYVKRYGPVTSAQVRERFDMAPPTFYNKIKKIAGIKVTELSSGNKPMLLEIDNAAPLQAPQ